VIGDWFVLALVSCCSELEEAVEVVLEVAEVGVGLEVGVSLDDILVIGGMLVWLAVHVAWY
jgi:hypothetical protein